MNKDNPVYVILDKVAKLIDVKTLITLYVIFGVVNLANQGKIDPNSLKDMALMIIGYFFGAKSTGQKMTPSI